MIKEFKVTALEGDFECMVENWDHPASPTQRYEIFGIFGKYVPRSAMYRRYSFWNYHLGLELESYVRLVADLAAHDEAQLLKLTPGEFFGLQLGAWRYRNHVTYQGARPFHYLSLLVTFADYKRARANHAGHRDEGKRLLEVRALLFKRYEPESIQLRRDHLGLTIH